MLLKGAVKKFKHVLPIHARKLYDTKTIIHILEYASNVWSLKNNKVLLDSFLGVPHFPSTEALSDLNWMNLSARRQMQRCFFMYHLINDNDRNDTIVRGVDYHIQNTRSKDSIRFIKSSSNWGLLRSVNSALTELQPHNTCVQPFSFSLSSGPDK